MQLTHIDIQHLPGIEPLRVDGFQPGVNFIVGPNAIGKSSLIRALQLLLAQPRRGDAVTLNLSATFQRGEDAWRVTRQGPHRTWTKAGQAVDPPPLPDADALHCYWLDAESLLAPDEARESQLRRRLQAALAGGIDMTQVRATADLELEPFPRALYQNWRSARQRQQHTEREYQRLEDARATLAELRAQQAEARTAAERIARLERARELNAAIVARRSAEQRLAEWPAWLATMRGDEDEQANQLAEQREAVEAERLRQEARLAENARQQQATGLTSADISRSELATLRQRLDQLAPLAARLDQKRDALTDAEARRDAAIEALGGEPTACPVVDPATIDAIAQALQRRNEAATWAARLESPGRGVGLGDRIVAVVGTVAGLVAATIAGSSGAPLAAAAAGIAALAGLARVLEPVLRRNDGASAARQQYEAAEQQLQRHLAQADLHGLPATDGGLPRLLELASALDQARTQVAVAAAQVDTTQAQYETQRTEIQQQLAAYGTQPANDLTALQGALQDLDDRLSRYEQLTEQARAIEAQNHDAAIRLNQIAERQTALFERLGLGVGDQAGLSRIIEQQRAYQTACQTLEQARQAERQLTGPLQGDDALLAQAQADDDTALQQAIEDGQQSADRLDELTREIARIERDLEQAGSDEALADAVTTATNLANTLAERRDRRAQAAIGAWLLEAVESDYRRDHEPRLIREARARFEAFTQSRWSLTVDAEHQPRAWDCTAAVSRPLAELSAGTRMQLLLAARLAWARDQEQDGPRLPLALDEALSNTDHQRFAAVARNLSELADTDNRQILYLTARPEDIQLWQAATGEAPHCIDLAQARQIHHRAVASLTLPARPQVPAPGDMDAVAYAETLAVPAVAIHQPATAIHCFHLLRDNLNALHHLLSNWQIETLGALETWLASPAGEQALATDPLPADLPQRAVIARRWLAIARQGRNRPVDRSALSAAGVLSDRMLELVDAQAQALDRDPDRLIAALRDRAVPRLKATAIEALEQWLLDEGWLDRRPARSPEAITRELLAELGHRYSTQRIQSVSDWLAAGSGLFV